MSVKIDDDMNRIRLQKKQGMSFALRLILEDIQRTSNPKTPKLTGDLRRRVLKQVLGHKAMIRWQTHYAYYQERGYTSGPVRRYTTPGTGAHFAETAVKKVAKDSRKHFRKAGVL